jgi:hypothetical protein
MPAHPLSPCRIPPKTLLRLKQEAAFLKSLERRDAERRRARTRQLIDTLADETTADARVAAAKARARAVHAQIDDITAQADLNAGQEPQAFNLAAIRIDDLDALFAIRDELPAWLHHQIKTVYAKIHWKTRKGKKGFFNKAVHDNGIPLDKALTILAHLYHIPDESGIGLDGWVDSILECGLYPRLKKGKFEYGRRCQDSDHCDLCNYLNITDGLKTLSAAYSPRMFYRAGYLFAITVAPRTNRATAKAVGRTLTPADWDYENPDSVIYREGRRSRAFIYPRLLDGSEDWEVQSKIRRFLGAGQVTFGRLVKNGWLDGIRARVDNSIQFIPFASHQHWHAMGSSHAEHDPQKMAEFIKNEVDSVLAQTCPGIYAHVMVASILTPEDLGRWVKYGNKCVDLVAPVASVYNRYPGLRRGDPIFRQFIEELRYYLQRTREVFKGARLQVLGEQGAHTYMLRRHYVRGNHKFGRDSVLTEPERHRLWRKTHRRRAAARRAQGRGSGRGRP